MTLVASAKPDFDGVEIRAEMSAKQSSKIQSLYQGRPVSLQEIECSVPMTFMDRYEELEHWKPFAYPETHSHPGSPHAASPPWDFAN
ncbi:hypothetical protein N7474_006887 [Penicillium riverlandense]|uniref:uncharacterized protein n=1 Tax=Penicillium riverlandense TaxID=1903569 RepID=UPI0025493DEE|nr:uncharacterized protein N7474_006887 [Penicillium riverlandense]KAJ5815110.1 hypothetical protein N7474_006887 [Penicillium riverlandense]